MRYLLCALLLSFGSAAFAGPTPSIPVLSINDAVINPVTSEYIVSAIDSAEQANAPAVVIELDTPGGLLSSARTIVKKIMNAKVPVIVYVAPSGSRAGSAGVFLTLAAHVAAMAPSTNIGAAHPVEFGEAPGTRSFKGIFKKGGSKGEKEKTESRPEPSPMQEKILNDTVAWVTGIAKERGRNANWAARAVKESISSREDEALKAGVIDFVAKDLQDLLAKADGRKVHLASGREVVLHVKGVPTVLHPMSLRQEILNVLINPNIAYLLMILGFYGLLFEITHPGGWFPGVAGLVCLILAFYAFQTLPTNYAGLALIGLAIILFIAEVKVTSYGLLAISGIICMLLGSLLLFNSQEEFMRLSWKVIVPVTLSTAAIFIFLVSLSVKAQRRPKAAGVEALVGAVAEVSADLPRGKVFVEGETWDAVSEGPVPKGARVRIVAVDGMTLKVEKM